MEENKTHIKQILKQASTQKASSDLAQRVLGSWKAEQAPLTDVPPLISKRVWFLIATTFLGLVAWLLMSYTGGSAQTKIGELLNKLDFSFHSSVLNWSPILMMSIAAFALMIGINIMIHKSKNDSSAYLQH